MMGKRVLHIRVHVLFAGELRNNPLQFPQASGVQTEVQTGVTGDRVSRSPGISLRCQPAVR